MPEPVKQRSYGHSIVADSSRGVGLEEAIVAASETGGGHLMLRKRRLIHVDGHQAEFQRFCVAKGCCDCFSNGNRSPQQSLIVRFFTFVVVTPSYPLVLNLA